MYDKELASRILKLIRTSPYSDAIGEVYLFGSHARGDARPDSDIDLIVELLRPMDWDFISLNLMLEEALGKKVDLLTTRSINHRLAPYIHADKILLNA